MSEGASTRQSGRWGHSSLLGVGMKLKCGRHWHDVTPTALLLFCEAMMEGDTVRVTTEGVVFMCVKNAVTRARLVSIRKRYKGNRIIIDGEVYGVERVPTNV